MIKVLYFASIKEKIGLESENIQFRNGLTLALLISELSEKHPHISSLMNAKGFLFAVNQEVSDFSALLTDGDEVAILPPLSGGNWEWKPTRDAYNLNFLNKKMLLIFIKI